MNAIKLETIVDEALARAVPRLRPLLGQRVELIALSTEASPTEATRKLTLDDLRTHRVPAPPGAAPLSDAEIERAILTGALDGNV